MPNISSALNRGLITFFALMVVSTAGANDLFAFSYDEHCRISNASLRLSLAELRQRRPRLAEQVEWGERLDALEMLANRPCVDPAHVRQSKDTFLSYGDLVARVDFAQAAVVDFYAGEGNRNALVDFESGSIPMNAVSELSHSSLQQYRALKENAEHFGLRAVLAHRIWHVAALDQAANSYLGRALVLNAFADHYLQDQFAPGHVMTRRYALDDAVALGMHDRHNRIGAEFRTAALDSLLPYLDLAVSRVDAGADTTIERVIRGACGSTSHHRGNLLHACQTELERPLWLLGDNQLYLNPRQELFLILLFARSISDVLDARLRNSIAGADHFQNVEWVPYRPVASLYGSWVRPQLQLEYGAYAPDTVQGLRVLNEFDRSPILLLGVESPLGTESPRVALGLGTILLAGAGNILEAAGADDVIGSRDILYGGVEVLFDGQSKWAGVYSQYSLYMPKINSRGSILMGARTRTGGASLYGSFGIEMGFGLAHIGVSIGKEFLVTDETTRAPMFMRTTLRMEPPIRRRANDLPAGYK